MDTRLSNSPITCVQTNDGSFITGTTSITDISTSSYAFGIHTINFSGNSYGKSSFFTYNYTTKTMKIENEIMHTGYTLNANYGSWGYYNGRQTDSASFVGYRCTMNYGSISYGNNELN